MKHRSASVPALALSFLVACTAPVDEPTGQVGAAVKAALGSGSSGGGPAPKVAICHIPPGNPENAHTIVVGAAAVDAHLDHGDSLGECPESTTTGGGGCPCPDASSSSAGGTATSGAGGCDGSTSSAGGEPINSPKP